MKRTATRNKTKSSEGRNMLRIPNPGSNIDIFIRIFRDLHSILKDRVDFDLDDMTLAMLERNNVSSQGAFGEEALRRSTRPDRSRDPLYNQSKMYAELFRTLGWIQSTTEALRFSFSWLGEHVARVPNARTLTIECLLGIAYPNDILGVQGGQSVRVYSAILNTAHALGGKITRDEMIIGPLSLLDDRNDAAIATMLEKLRRCRPSKHQTRAEILTLSGSRGITPITMGNYTRFPIAAIQWAGWFRKTGLSVLTLTDEGRATIDRLSKLRDFRMSDYKAMPEAAKAPFIRLTAHLMLERAGFDISPASAMLAEDRDTLERHGIPVFPDPLFSPFQQLSRTEVNSAFPYLQNETPGLPTSTVRAAAAAASSTYGRTQAKASLLFTASSEAAHRDTETEALERELRIDLERANYSIAEAVELFAARHSKDNQDIFYPLVAALFRLIGFECRTSRRGVNYDRADAMIIDQEHSIPIEIKSPGEETELSVKAIRQAVENKIILLSRGQFNTKAETTTLAVGFNAPNERSEVRELIGDVHRAFGFNIGALDIRSLAGLAFAGITSGKKLELKGFKEMKGVADASDFFSA